MATPIGGGVVVLQTSSPVPAIDSVPSLLQQAAECVNGQKDPTILDMAYTGLRRAIDDLNMRYTFDFLTDTDQDRDLVEGQNFVDLPENAYAIRAVQLINKDGEIVDSLRFMPWEQLVEQARNLDGTGVPEIWTVRDMHTEHDLLLYPIPSAGAVSAGYKVRTTVLKRLPQVSRDGSIAGPRELNELLVTYMEYHVLFNQRGEDVARWQHKLAAYRDKLDALKGQQQQAKRGPTQMRVARGYTRITPWRVGWR